MNSDRVFVKKEDEIKISVYFSKTGDFEIFRESEVGEEKKADCEELTIRFRLPNYGISKQIMRDSVDFSTGTANMHFGLFNNALFTYLATGWNAQYEEEVKKDDDTVETVVKDHVFNFVTLNEMRPDIAMLFVDLLREKLQEIGVYDAILFS